MITTTLQELIDRKIISLTDGDAREQIYEVDEQYHMVITTWFGGTDTVASVKVTPNQLAFFDGDGYISHHTDSPKSTIDVQLYKLTTDWRESCQ